MEPIQTSSQPVTPSQNTNTTPAKSTNWGCFLLAGIGCLGLLIVVGLLIGGIFLFLAARTETDRNTNFSNYNYNDNYNTNTENTNDNDESYKITEPLSATARAYQIVAYPDLSYTDWSYPSVQATLPYTTTQPLIDGDHGHLWVGATLDNGYFIQVGMATSDQVDTDGNMIWNYFWEVWDDQNNYIYGYQELMTRNQWDQNSENTFSVTCQDPETGTWEFWVNEETVGTADTGDCGMDLASASLTWEIVTDKTPADTLPQFGPFELGTMQYWDGYDWLDVPSATLTYGYGLVQDGTEVDQKNVCPPYGVMAASEDSSVFSAGSTLTCLENGAVLWAL